LLLYGLARILIERGWIERDFIGEHTCGFEEFSAFVSARTTKHRFDAESVGATTGLTIEQLHRLAETIHQGKRVSFWWTMGVNQGHEATRTAQAIINLALMTGNIGRPGTGANSITGQCNAMGSRLFSNTTNLLGGHDFTKAKDREKVARALHIPVERIPQQNSWAYDQILDGIGSGKIKGLWVIATNTAHSWIQQKRARELLSKLDFLVVQDMYASTETAQQAHLILPAAGWGEKDGTFINSERRFGLLKKVARAPGQALADFKIFQLVAHYWGCGEVFSEWTSPQAVFQILKRVSAGQPCDITGIEDFRMLDECGGVQWPWVKEAESGKLSLESRKGPFADASNSQLSTFNSQPAAERRLFDDGKFFHVDGKARFIFEAPRPAPERTSKEFPFVLMTGRGTSAQWHTQTRTGKSDVLRKLHPAGVYVEVSPADAEALGLESGARLRVRSSRGVVEAMLFITATVAPGQVFMPMHYVETNNLTLWHVDPYSRQPSYKSCAVRLERIK
jgi:assimilatory nitrate reductase catalytic subunit